MSWFNMRILHEREVTALAEAGRVPLPIKTQFVIGQRVVLWLPDGTDNTDAWLTMPGIVISIKFDGVGAVSYDLAVATRPQLNRDTPWIRVEDVRGYMTENEHIKPDLDGGLMEYDDAERLVKRSMAETSSHLSLVPLKED